MGDADKPSKQEATDPADAADAAESTEPAEEPVSNGDTTGKVNSHEPYRDSVGSSPENSEVEDALTEGTSAVRLITISE